MRALGLGLLWAILAACAPATVLPTRMPSALVVELPTVGSVYYGSSVQVQGRAPQGAQVIVRWLDEDNVLLGEERVTVEADSTWQAWLSQLEVADAPRALMVQVLLAGDDAPRFVQPVLVAPLSDRPSGIWGQIVFPPPDAVLGGDEILVEGVFSGEANALLTLTLEGLDGSLISTLRVAHLADNAHDAHFWRADLPTLGYVRPAWVRLRDARGTLLDEVLITLDNTAG